MIHVSRHFRARADEAHVAFQYIPELRQLVQLAFAENATDPGDTGIAILGDRGPDLIRLSYHGPEFVDTERLAMEPNPDLPVEDVTAIGQLYYSRNQRKERAQHNQAAA